LLPPAGVIHNIGFTHGSQDMFGVLLRIIHIWISHLCTLGTSDFDGPRLLCYSYFCSFITSLPI
jgi:hypothetical protein